MGGNNPYEKLEMRVGISEEGIANDTNLEKELQTARRELERKENQIESAFRIANAVSMEAEINRIEFNQVFNTASDGIWIMDNEFNVLRINQSLCTAIGKNKDDVVGSKCHDLFNGSLCRSATCPMMLIMKGQKVVECDIERGTGNESKLFILTATPFRGIDGTKLGIVESFKDITERKHMEEALQKANQELQRLTYIDALTQVANRRRFDEHLKEEWLRMAREKKPLSLIMCDVDWFKLYNDHYGHPMGDACLCEIAGTISSCVKRPADLVARYGGEEFSMTLPDTSAEGAMHIAESIRAKVESLLLVHAASPRTHVTLSLGVSCIIPRQEVDTQVLVEMSDRALYEAKQTGRNRVVLKNIDI